MSQRYPLHTSSKEQSVLRKRFWAAKQQYNALLGEALRRLQAMRSDKRWQEVKKHYATPGEKHKGNALFKILTQAHGYREYDLYSYTKPWNKQKHFLAIGARISQKLAKRAFEPTFRTKFGTKRFFYSLGS